MRVLVVDDDTVSRTVVEVLLSKHGIEVHEAKSGLQAISMTRNASYDFILMDIKMSEMNGFDAARAIINSKGPCAKSPIIALSALMKKDDKQKAFAAGMVGFLRKPFSAKETLKVFDAIIIEQKLALTPFGYPSGEVLTMKKPTIAMGH
jgi:CheY-like chemotaxis protein